MSPEDADRPDWFTIKIDEVDAEGVEIPKLTKLLQDLSSAFYALAREKKGDRGPRPGRRAVAEEALAALRLVRVVPGSLLIQLAPPSLGDELPLFPDELMAEDIVVEFYRELQSIESGDPPEENRGYIRRSVDTVLRDAGELGPRIELRLNPRVPRPGIPVDAVFQRTFKTRDVPAVEPASTRIQRRTLSGHAYMVDVEPGRQRLRLKLPDGRDLTMDVTSELASDASAALDRAVELTVEEELEDGSATKRTVLGLAVLPSSGAGSDQPPRTIGDLEEEQGLAGERPDYAALASEVWPDEDALEGFLEKLREMRRVEV